jgi:predicted transcriptional regulator
MEEKLQMTIFKHLFKELWLQSNNCQESIDNMWFSISEISKFSNKSRIEILKYLNILIDKNLIEIEQKEPLLYRFTEKGKQFRNEKDFELLIKTSPNS